MNTDSTGTTPTTTPQETAGLKRRTIVRTAAHSAWAVPAVMAATSAPAFAASPPAGLEITSFTSGYWKQGVAGSNYRPDRLTFAATIKNNAAVATTALSFDVLIPKGTARFGTGDLYDSIHSVGNQSAVPGTFVAANPTGWTSAIAAISDPTYSHRITFTRTGAQIAPGASLTFNDAVIVYWVNFATGQEAAQDASPFKSWVGSAYTVGSVANDTVVADSSISTANVAEASDNVSADTVLNITSSFAASRTTTTLTVSGAGSNGYPNGGSPTAHGQQTGAVMNIGRKTCGPITFTISVPRIANHKYYSLNPPGTVGATANWSFLGMVTNANNWVFSWRATTPVAYAATSVAGHASALANTPAFPSVAIALTNNTLVSGNTTTNQISANAFASFGVAPTVSDSVGT